MAREQKQQAARDNVGINDPIPVAHSITLAEEKALHIADSYTEERDLINQLIGQVQMARAISKFTDVVGLAKLQHIKESKSYRALSGKTGTDINGDEIHDVGTWEGFCRALGTSANKVDEDLTNLRVFGDEAMEQLTRIGAGYRELRQLRKLPEDIRQEIAGQLVNLDDKEEIVALIDDLAARHAREKDELQKENAELKADAEANEQVISDKSAKLDAMEREIYKLRNKSGDWHPRVFEITTETTRILGMAMEQLDKLDTMRDVILHEDFGEEDRETALEMMAIVYYDAQTQLINRIAEISDACDNVFIGYKEKARPMLDLFAQGKAE
jgi:hypothetical protein